MESIRQYILSVISVAILCAMAQMLLTNGLASSLVKLITGLMITVVALQPILEIDLTELNGYFLPVSTNGLYAAEAGAHASENAVSELIVQRLETYICNKAEEMGAEVTADVLLAEENPPVPETIMVIGNISPYVKARLSECMQKDLGVSKDNQIWIS